MPMLLVPANFTTSNFKFNRRMERKRIIFVGNYDPSNSEILSVPSLMDDIQIDGIIESAEKTIDTYQSMHPDVILIDAHLDSMSGFEVARFIKEQEDRVKVVIVSEEFSLYFLNLAIEMNLNGYIAKNSSKALIKHTLVNVLARGSSFDASIREH
jgi:DNA-binding NarL/FixJ family response regulator